MPDIQDRTAREERLAAKLEAVFRDAADAGHDLAWTRFRAAVEQALRDELAALFLVVFFLLASDDLDASFPGDSSWVLLGDPTRPGRIAGDLTDSAKTQLATGSAPAVVFSPSRATGIAITEITRTISQAEAAAARANATKATRDERYPTRAGEPLSPDEVQLNAPPRDPREPLRAPGQLIYWITANDAAVCPICGPLHQREYADWAERFPDGPPAHPRCRCYLEWERIG